MSAMEEDLPPQDPESETAAPGRLTALTLYDESLGEGFRIRINM
jgi:hypothetical protein